MLAKLVCSEDTEVESVPCFSSSFWWLLAILNMFWLATSFGSCFSLHMVLFPPCVSEFLHLQIVVGPRTHPNKSYLDYSSVTLVPNNVTLWSTEVRTSVYFFLVNYTHNRLWGTMYRYKVAKLLFLIVTWSGSPSFSFYMPIASRNQSSERTFGYF